MEEFFDFLNLDFLHGNLNDNWFDNVHHHFGSELTDDVIIQSIKEASAFFNMNAPMEIHEGWTTGVLNGMTFTENDDILVFNRQQLRDLGITDKVGFDLVMTHEGMHRTLQGMDTGFTDHQEELCCDYMAGVRAGLNGMDEGKLISALQGTEKSETHPSGMIRAQAIEEGVSFAHKYMQTHDEPPTLSDCLEHLEKSGIFSKLLVNLHPEVQQEIKGFTQADVDWYEKQARISSGTEREHWEEKAQWAKSHLHSLAPTGTQDEKAPGEMKSFTQADVDYYESQVRRTHGAEQEAWMEKARWAKRHLEKLVPDDQQTETSPEKIKGFTQADVDWYEKQARISSGSEREHWLKEAQWAKGHLHGFVGLGGKYGNATGDYWDDSHPDEDKSRFY